MSEAQEDATMRDFEGRRTTPRKLKLRYTEGSNHEI